MILRGIKNPILSLSFVVCLFFIATGIKAQELPRTDTTDVLNLSLEELMKFKSKGLSSEMEALINAQIEVATKNSLSVRKSPNIISLITEEEIVRSGARDLKDVLQLVPGLDFGMDVQGQIGLGVRGSWANEGKILLLLDGQEMNEIAYGTLQFGNNFPLDQVKKIEIIRGPGSAIYGGFAEYMVINIVTKNANDINGVNISTSYGQMQNTYARRNITMSTGKNYKQLNYTISGFLGEGNRSEGDYTDVYGGKYNMATNSRLDNSNINVGLNYKKFHLRAIYDRMNSSTRDAFDVSLSKAYPTNFTGYFIEARYDWRLSNKLTITPQINLKRQNPWEFNDEADSIDDYETTQIIADRYRGNLIANWDVKSNINIVGGIEAYYDYATSLLPFVNSGTNQVDYFNTAAFVQSIIKNKIANVTLGARLDNNNAFGNAFVPRIGLTKKIKKLNFKLLWGDSFRAPSIENYHSEIGLRSVDPIKSKIGINQKKLV